jgi:predicted DNA-binding protein (UPF0251 family)
MTRPQCDKKIGYCPEWKGFKPVGGSRPENCAIYITKAEVEALRLKNVTELDQTAAAQRMRVSQSTFQRVLASAYKKVSHALIQGRELVLEQG